MQKIKVNKSFLDILNKIDSRKTDDLNSRVLIIDGTNSFLRIWNSMAYTTENGDHVGGIVGFLRSIGSNIRDFDATRCIIVFDGKGGSQRRKKIYSEYKEHRSGKYNLRREEFGTKEDERESQKRQLIRIIQYLDSFPVNVLCLDNVEADDVVAYIVSDVLPKTSKVRIVSTDRDFLQLVSDSVEVYSPVKKKIYNPNAIRDEFGFHPNNYLLYRTLTGDTSDNIDGVKGIGLKTLLKQFPELADNEVDLSMFYSIVDSIANPTKIQQSILESKSLIDRNYKLMQLSDVDISGQTKIKIIETLRQPVGKSNSHQFVKMLIDDGIGQTFKYPNDWIRDTFGRLDRFTSQGQ